MSSLRPRGPRWRCQVSCLWPRCHQFTPVLPPRADLRRPLRRPLKVSDLLVVIGNDWGNTPRFIHSPYIYIHIIYIYIYYIYIYRYGYSVCVCMCVCVHVAWGHQVFTQLLLSYVLEVIQRPKSSLDPNWGKGHPPAIHHCSTMIHNSLVRSWSNNG